MVRVEKKKPKAIPQKQSLLLKTMVKKPQSKTAYYIQTGSFSHAPTNAYLKKDHKDRISL